MGFWGKDCLLLGAIALLLSLSSVQQVKGSASLLVEGDFCNTGFDCGSGCCMNSTCWLASSCSTMKEVEKYMDRTYCDAHIDCENSNCCLSGKCQVYGECYERYDWPLIVGLVIAGSLLLIIFLTSYFWIWF